MNRAWFIAGTDTGVGKTLVAELLLQGLRALNGSVVGMKPIASGCTDRGQGPRSDDALRLLVASTVTVPYEMANPYAFVAPIAPHIAAAEAGVAIELAAIRQCYAALRTQAGCVVVEGVGGWRVPINARQTMADVAVALGCPVILVVGMRLGCLNHALLTADAVVADGLPLAGWVANTVAADMDRLAENIAALEQRLPAPRLVTISHRPSPAQGAALAHSLALAVCRD